MKQEIRILLTAVMFYTRIPCPSWVDHDEVLIRKATRYFPLIGWLVGSVVAGVCVLASWLFTPFISILLGIAAGILTTGAFHEDGFADVCDGFGGGWTKEQILTIMKDSRVGTYGVVGLLLLFAIKGIALFELYQHSSAPLLFVGIVVAAHALSRFMAVIAIRFSEYAREGLISKAKPVAVRVVPGDFYIALLFGFAPLILFSLYTHWVFLLAAIPLLGFTSYLIRYFHKWIGGYTGDCLGATQQFSEVIFLLSTLALWRFV